MFQNRRKKEKEIKDAGKHGRQQKGSTEANNFRSIYSSKSTQLPAALVSGVPTGRVGGRWVRVRSLTLVSVCPSSAPDCDRPASTPR